MSAPALKLSTRIPEMSVAYALYWSLCCVFAGMLLAPLVLPSPPIEDHAGHYTHDHSTAHGLLEVTGTPPSIALSVLPDLSGGWTVRVETQDFTFTPLAVDRPAVENTGHGHLYVNGEKLARLYGPYFHLSGLPSGRHEVHVTLNANNHDTWSLDGAEIAATAEIIQP